MCHFKIKLKIMKKFFIPFACCFLALFSCNKALDTTPQDFLSPVYYFNNEKELNNAVTGVYDVMGSGTMYSGQDGLMTTMDVADEDYTTATSGPQVYFYDTGNGTVSSLWQTLYKGIERANVVLDNINKPAMSETRRAILKGEVQFLRAYYYFVLVENWGDVPLHTKSTASVNDIYYPRVPANDVYNFIISEMTEAEAAVQDISVTSAGRISKSAVEGILARVCLFKAGYPNNDAAKYADALKWAKKVIDMGYHDLNPSYQQVFINLIQNKYDTKESIWEVEFFTTGAGEAYSEVGSIGVNNGISQSELTLGYSGAQYRVQKHLYDKYEATDTRRDWAIAPYSYSPNGTSAKANWLPTQITDRFIGKWRREYELTSSKIKNSDGTNFPMLRYADVLLMAAEAENEVNGPSAQAHAWLNKVRARASASLYTGATTITSKNAFRQVIQDERSRELCFEAWRKLDLIRWNILMPTMAALIPELAASTQNYRAQASTAAVNITSKYLLQPIPLREISLNNLLVQNPSW
jgi:hypothetical protein